LVKPKLVRKLSILPYQALGACFNTYRSFFNMSLSIFNLQINFSYYIVPIWYTCSAATQSAQSCASSMCFLQGTICLTVGVCPLLSLQLFLLESGTLAPAAALRLRMTASFSLWLLKSESNSSYFITTTVSSETESGSITDTEDISSSFMGVMLS
jgi:hypothetical protein